MNKVHIKMDNANKDERRIPIKVWKSSGKKEGAAKAQRPHAQRAEYCLRQGPGSDGVGGGVNNEKNTVITHKD